MDAKFFILSKLLFFLVSYETVGLRGHPVIEKFLKITFFETLLVIFRRPKMSDLSHAATVRGCSRDLRRVYKLEP